MYINKHMFFIRKDNRYYFEEFPIISNFLYFRFLHTCAVYQSALHENRPVVAVTGDYNSPSTTRIVEILDYTTENPQWTLRKYLKIDIFKSKNHANIHAFQHCTLLIKLKVGISFFVGKIVISLNFFIFECRARIFELKSSLPYF